MRVHLGSDHAGLDLKTALARRLTELGYTSVYDYELGKQDWVEGGLPTETGVAAVAS